MSDLVLSYGFQSALWALLAGFALYVAYLIVRLRARERRLGLVDSIEELVIKQKQCAETAIILHQEVRDLEERKSERDGYIIDVEQLRLEIAEQQLQVDRLCQEKNQLAHVHSDIESSREVLGELAERIAIHQHLVEQNHELRKERDRLQQETLQLRHDHKRLSDQMEDATVKNTTIIRDFDKNRKTLQDLQTEHDRLRRAINTINTQRSRQDTQLKDTSEALIVLTKQVESRKKQIAEAQEEFDAVRSSLEKLREECDLHAGYQERMVNQWKQLEDKYKETLSTNLQNSQSWEDRWKRLQERTKASLGTMS